MVYTKVVTNKSPWLQGAQLGGVYTNPASHGEGRFVASEEWLDKLFANLPDHSTVIRKEISA